MQEYYWSNLQVQSQFPLAVYAGIFFKLKTAPKKNKTSKEQATFLFQ
jgi:hypothetical protein